MQVVQGDLVILPNTTNYAAQLKRSDIIKTYAVQKNLHRVAFEDHRLNAVAHEKDGHNFLLPLITEQWQRWRGNARSVPRGTHCLLGRVET